PRRPSPRACAGRAAEGARSPAAGAAGAVAEIAEPGPEVTEAPSGSTVDSGAPAKVTMDWPGSEGLPPLVIPGVASVGALDCGYLTLVKLGQAPLSCPTDPSAGCGFVLNSEFASVGPVPLAALGLVAYAAAAALSLAGQRELLWWLSLAQTVASAGLMLVLMFVLKAPCAFCALSALTSAVMFSLVEVDSRRRQGLPDRRSIFVWSAAVAALALIGATLSPKLRSMQGFFDLTQQYKPEHPPLLTTSSAAEIALAKHLKASGAMCYTAWWCPHCQESSGSSSGERRPRWGRLCSAPARSGACWPSARTSSKSGVCPSRIMGDGKKHSGIQALSELAEYSGFTAFPKDSFRERTDQESWSTSGAPRTPSRPRASPAATTTTTSERRCRGAGTAARAPLGGAPARRCTGNGRPSDGKARGAAVASRWPRVALAFSSGEPRRAVSACMCRSAARPHAAILTQLRPGELSLATRCRLPALAAF
ncbi:unnamed protein product, partial [Prorocentrum cordatum]